MPVCDFCNSDPGQAGTSLAAGEVMLAFEAGVRPPSVIAALTGVAAAFEMPVDEEGLFHTWAAGFSNDKSSWLLCQDCRRGFESARGDVDFRSGSVPATALVGHTCRLCGRRIDADDEAALVTEAVLTEVTEVTGTDPPPGSSAASPSKTDPRTDPNGRPRWTVHRGCLPDAAQRPTASTPARAPVADRAADPDLVLPPARGPDARGQDARGPDARGPDARGPDAARADHRPRGDGSAADDHLPVHNPWPVRLTAIGLVMLGVVLSLATGRWWLAVVGVAICLGVLGIAGMPQRGRRRPTA